MRDIFMSKNLFCIAVIVTLTALFSIETSAQATSGKVFWYGMVDNKVQLVIKGTSLEQRTVEGQTLAAGSYSFTTPLPQSDTTVRVTKLEGRGKVVTVVQQPSAANNFEAIVEIIDDGGGAREYLIEVAW
jgi:hypothetical protein